MISFTLDYVLPGGSPSWGSLCTLTAAHSSSCSRTRSPFHNMQVICLQSIVEELASPGGERHFVGKRGGAKSVRQGDINELLVRLCLEVGSGQSACSDSMQAVQPAQECMPERPAPATEMMVYRACYPSVCTSDLHDKPASVLQLLAGSSCC